MFKKISLLVSGTAAAETTATAGPVSLCAAAAVDAYSDSVVCETSTIELAGGTPPTEKEAVADGYKATMKVKFLDSPIDGAKGLFFGICVAPVGLPDSDDTYLKDPRGMCLGINTGCVMDNQAGDDATILNSHYGLMAGWFGYSLWSELEASVAQSPVVVGETAPAATALLCQAASVSAQVPKGSLTMSAKSDTYGENTAPTGATTAFYTNEGSQSAATSWTLGGTTETSVTKAGATEVVATWYMPMEAATYADVPRLSPNDSVSGWQVYAPNTFSTAKYGQMVKVGSVITQKTIMDSFATTVAAGVALVGATALSF